MNIFIPINGGKSFVYIPTSTTYQTQLNESTGTNQTQLNESTGTNQTVEIDPVVAWSIIGAVHVLIIFVLIYFERMLKDL